MTRCDREENATPQRTPPCPFCWDVFTCEEHKREERVGSAEDLWGWGDE